MLAKRLYRHWLVPKQRHCPRQRSYTDPAPKHQSDLHDLDLLRSFCVGDHQGNVIEHALPHINLQILHQRETEPRQIDSRL